MAGVVLLKAHLTKLSFNRLLSTLKDVKAFRDLLPDLVIISLCILHSKGY